MNVLRTLTELKEEFLKLPFYNTYMKTLGWIDMYLAVPEDIDALYENIDKLSFFYHIAGDISLIQKQYAWYVDSALDDGGQRRKKATGRENSYEFDGGLCQRQKSGQ